MFHLKKYIFKKTDGWFTLKRIFLRKQMDDSICKKEYAQENRCMIQFVKLSWSRIEWTVCCALIATFHYLTGAYLALKKKNRMKKKKNTQDNEMKIV